MLAASDQSELCWIFLKVRSDLDPLLYTVAACSGTMLLDLAILLDGSSSVAAFNWYRLGGAIMSLLRQLNIGPDNVRVAVISFSNSAVINFGLDTFMSIEEVEEALSNLPYPGGRTNTASALRVLTEDVFALQNGDRVHAPNLAIIITDGKSTSEPGELKHLKGQLSLNNVGIMAVGISDNVDVGELTMLASPREPLWYLSYEELDMGMVLDQLMNTTPLCHGV